MRATGVDLSDSSQSTPMRPWTWRRFAAFAAGVLVLVALWVAPLNGSADARHATAIAVATIVWWATEPFSQATMGVVALLLYWFTGLGSLSVLASGFWSDTTGFLLGAFLLSRVVTVSGLARRLALTITLRLGSSYSGLLLGLLVVDFLLTFLIPSGIARVAILAAIVASVMQAIGLPPRDPVARGLMVAVTCAAGIFDKMVLGGTSSILANGIIERVSGVHISYGRWFLAFVPGDALTILGCWWLIPRLFPSRSHAIDGSQAHFRHRLAHMGPWTTAETRAVVLVGSAVVLWMTDFAHGLRAGHVALAVGGLSLVPRVGVIGLRDLARLPWHTLIVTASALGMSTLLANGGALHLLTDGMVVWMRALMTGPTTSALVLYWAAFLYHLLLGGHNLFISVTLPAVITLGESLGHNPVVIGLIWVFGTAGRIFPYQSGVLMVGYSCGYFDGRDLMKVGLLLALLESLVLVLLVLCYWPFIGLL